ncbi:hypothetical protein [Mucilaginibacter jinjuensis]|uniref:Uncharacterized protein n=1 Tax=Mucilaginibacter jinjuensis TaxID=1176721 RepID=A0ABY7T8C7_9SPHI|nr:hypothetical protein [Mucilaginibacter jinjuensis]WCT12617.1 hypothetical protein PQO05_01565 [Mucilaginibacter jinjuensis]
MLDLNDSRWKLLIGGYKIPYDASIPLRALMHIDNIHDAKTIIDELFDELHHQGDVDLASYYAVPHLVSIAQIKHFIIADILSLIITIEIVRHNNIPVPNDLEHDYNNALKDIGTLGQSLINHDWDLGLAAISLAAIAISKGQTDLAHAITILEDPGTLDELLESY